MLFFVISFQDIEVISHTLSRSLKASTFEIFIIQEPGETSDLEILAVTGHPRPPSQGCKGRREGGGMKVLRHGTGESVGQCPDYRTLMVSLAVHPHYPPSNKIGRVWHKP